MRKLIYFSLLLVASLLNGCATYYSAPDLTGRIVDEQHVGPFSKA